MKTPDMIEAILERLSDGESLRSICRDDAMPDKTTVMRWLGDDVGFSEQYARAKEIGYDQRAEKVEQEIDDAEDIGKARLKLDFTKWYLSKLAPKKYGEKTTVDHSSSDGSMTPREPRYVLVDVGNRE
jgi:hypothetical protein